MAKFRVARSRVQSVAATLKTTQAELDEITGALKQCADQLEGQTGFGIESIRDSIRSCAGVVKRQQGNTQSLERFLQQVQQTTDLYEADAARTLEKSAPQAQKNPLWQVFPWAMFGIGGLAVQALLKHGWTPAASGKVEDHVGYKKDYTYEKDKGFVEKPKDPNKPDGPEWEIRAGLGKENSGDLLAYENGYRDDLMDIGGKVAIGSGVVSGFIGGIVNADKTMLGVEGTVSGSVASGEAHAKFGNEYFGVGQKVKGELLVAEAEAKVGAFIDHETGDAFVGAKAEAGIYAAKGEASVSFNILGTEISLAAFGNVGAGVYGELGFDSSEGFVIGAGATKGIGGGFKIGINPEQTIKWLLGHG